MNKTLLRLFFSIKKSLRCLSLILFLALSIQPNVLLAQCNNVQFDGSNSQLKMTGLSAPIEIIDVYNANWQSVFHCDGGDCGSQQTIPNLSPGLYHTNIQFYDANWQQLCIRAQDVTVSGGGSGGQADLAVSNIQGLPSSGAKGSVQNFTFDLHNYGDATANGAYKINIYLTQNQGVSQFDPIVGEINTGNTPVGTIPNVPAAITIPFNQNAGNYYIILRVDDGNAISESNELNNFVVSNQTIEVTGGSGGNTIQCGEIRIDYGDGIIAMKGQTGKNYFFKVHDLNAGWAEVFSCGYNCGSSQTATSLSDGDYLVRVYNESWSLICEQEINLVGGGGGCGANGDRDGDGVCDNVDNCPDIFNPDQADNNGNGIGDACESASGVCSFQTTHIYRPEFATFSLANPILSMNPENGSNYSFDLQKRSVGTEQITLDLNGNVTNSQFTPEGTGACGANNNCYSIEEFEDTKMVEVTKKDNNGATIWVKSYTINHAANINILHFNGGIEDMGDHLLLYKFFLADDGWFTVVIKLDNNGNQIWQNILNRHNDQPDIDFFRASMNGGYYLTDDQGNSGGINIIRIDASGNELWNNNTTGDLVSNKVFVLGETFDGTGFYYAMFRNNLPIVILRNPNTGQIIWERNLSTVFSPNRGLIRGFILGATITREGGIVAGYAWSDPSLPSNPTGYEYGKIDANGNLVWWHDLPTSITDEYSDPIASFSTVDGGYIFRSFKRLNRELFLLKMTNQGTLIPECDGSTGGNTIQCGEITIKYTSNSIEMNGQSGQNYNYKIHDLNNGWAEVFSCTYQCGSSQTANNLPSGRYLVKTFDASWSLVCEQEINLGAGSRTAPTNIETFTLYPNPAQEAIAIDLKEFAGEAANITINNIYGQIVYNQQLEKVPSDVLRIPLDGYVNGFYLVNIKMKNRLLKSEKFLIKRLY